jgi:tetratricopeptide (TPR) repeat protein
MQLGLLYDELGRPADAIPHLRHAARSTRDPEARLSLASALWSAQRPRDAIAALRELHAEFPSWTLAANNLAWMLATAADPELRDGTTAVAIAESLRESGALDRDTLAAAYASVGRFDDALVEIDAALAAARGSEDRVAVSELALRRARYAAREPFIDPASIAKTP